jgi:hypothetical protein
MAYDSGPGTLYGWLAKLEQAGLIEPLPEEDRRRPYRMTALGRLRCGSAGRSPSGSPLSVWIDWLARTDDVATVPASDLGIVSAAVARPLSRRSDGGR